MFRKLCRRSLCRRRDERGMAGKQSPDKCVSITISCRPLSSKPGRCSILACCMHMRQHVVSCCARAITHKIKSFPLRCGTLSMCRMSSTAPSQSTNTIQILAPLEHSTGRLAAILAKSARAGDCICLHGDVGAGKSVFRSVTNTQIPFPARLPTAWVAVLSRHNQDSG